MDIKELDPINVGLLAEAILHAYDAAWVGEDLTLRHLRVLLTLGCHQFASGEEPAEQGALARYLGWPESTLSRIIGDLAGSTGKVGQALVEISPNPANRKQHVIRLTDAAFALRDEGTRRVIARLEDWPYPMCLRRG